MISKKGIVVPVFLEGTSKNTEISVTRASVSAKALTEDLPNTSLRCSPLQQPDIYVIL
jgi:hypothetical protein